MKARTPARVTVAGVSTAALAAGAFIGAPPATAAEVTSDYVCSLPGYYEGTFPLTVDGAFPTSAVAGMPIPADLLGYTASMRVPADAAGMLGSVGADGGRSDDFGFGFAGLRAGVPAPLVLDQQEPHEDGSVVFRGGGMNGAFVTPEAGTQEITLPSGFTLTPTSDGEPMEQFSLMCESTAEQVGVGTIALSKQVSTTAIKRFKKGRLAVKIANEYGDMGGTGVSDGKVIVKKGKKKVGAGYANHRGVAKLKLRLKPGRHKLVAIFKGDAYSAKSKSAPKVVKVTR